jgi:hypothetical protein
MSNDVKPLLSDTTYNRLKELNTKVIPAAGALYYGLAVLWDFPKAEEVVGTLAVVATFIAIVLVWANKRYDASGAGIDGTVDVQDIDGRKTVVMDITTEPEDMINQKQVNLKVNNP